MILGPPNLWKVDRKEKEKMEENKKEKREVLCIFMRDLTEHLSCCSDMNIMMRKLIYGRLAVLWPKWY